ncbi:hypothetical protein NUW54_g12586 [Trametes sanguinea]|uniref:Uncharacterized protein n=1 Tax=Trametes sanguinea TaxID=158606 RepID=A0ACC1MWG9_9APHY|nr:hypothetical protein NUW54_g12586 [Trametes sanguinea]
MRPHAPRSTTSCPRAPSHRFAPSIPSEQTLPAERSPRVPGCTPGARPPAITRAVHDPAWAAALQREPRARTLLARHVRLLLRLAPDLPLLRRRGRARDVCRHSP